MLVVILPAFALACSELCALTGGLKQESATPERPYVFPAQQGAQARMIDQQFALLRDHFPMISDYYDGT